MCEKVARRPSVDANSAVVKRRKLSVNYHQVHSNSITWDDLNPDVVRHIISFVDPLDLLALAQVNKNLREIIADPAVWWSVHRRLTEPTAVNSYIDPLVEWRALCLTQVCTMQSVETTALNFSAIFPLSSYPYYGSDVFQRATDLGLLLREAGLYERSETVFAVTLNKAKELYGEVHERVADATYNLSLARGNLGKNCGEEGSRQLRKQAMHMYKEVFANQPHPKLASVIFSLADSYYVDGRYDDAETHYLQAMQIRQLCCPNDHEVMSESYSGLGLIYDAKGHWTQAEEYYQKALKIREQVLGKEHPKVARVLVNLGAMWKAQGDLDKTLSLYERALQIRQKYLGHNHPYTRRTLNILQEAQAQKEAIKRKRSRRRDTLASIEQEVLVSDIEVLESDSQEGFFSDEDSMTSETLQEQQEQTQMLVGI
eukprot:Colp12_sorted_trinity150504_noHs@6396